MVESAGKDDRQTQITMHDRISRPLFTANINHLHQHGTIVKKPSRQKPVIKPVQASDSEEDLTVHVAETEKKATSMAASESMVEKQAEAKVDLYKVDTVEKEADTSLVQAEKPQEELHDVAKELEKTHREDKERVLKYVGKTAKIAANTFQLGTCRVMSAVEAGDAVPSEGLVEIWICA